MPDKSPYPTTRYYQVTREITPRDSQRSTSCNFQGRGCQGPDTPPPAKYLFLPPRWSYTGIVPGGPGWIMITYLHSIRKRASYISITSCN